MINKKEARKRQATPTQEKELAASVGYLTYIILKKSGFTLI
jgi:hypothetical protein